MSLMNFWIKYFILLPNICCYIVSFSSEKLHINMSSNHIINSALNSDDYFSSIINSQGNIIIAGTVCSFIGISCTIQFQIYNNKFELINLKFYEGTSKGDQLRGFIQTSNLCYLLNMISIRKYEPYSLNIYRISNDLSQIFKIEYFPPDYFSALESFFPPIDILEGSSSFRIFFFKKTIKSPLCNEVSSIDIDKNSLSILEKLAFIFSSECCTTSKNFRFAKKLSNFFYIGGACFVNTNHFYGFLLQYDLNFIILNKIIDNQQNGIYSNIEIFNSNSLLLIKTFSNQTLGISQLSIPDLVIANNKYITILSDLIIDFSLSLLIIGHKIYYFSSIRYYNNTGILFSADLDTNQQEIFIHTFQKYPPQIKEFPSLKDYNQIKLYPLNSTYLISIGYSTINWLGYDSFIHLVSLDNPVEPTIQQSLIYGGTGNYKSSFIIDYNDTSLIVYGSDGRGLYFLRIYKENFTISLEGKYQLEYPITNAQVLKIEYDKLLVVGNFNSGISNIFISEIDKFLHGLKIDQKNWIKDDIIITSLIKVEANIFGIGGSIIISSTTLCFYLEINSSYSSIGIPIYISIPGYTCQINSLILSDQNKILGVGQTNNESSGLLLEIKPNKIFQIVYNYKQTIFTSIFQISNDLFVAGGYIQNSSFYLPYYRTFTDKLIPTSDWFDTTNINTIPSNFLKITNNIFVSTIAINNFPYLRFFSVYPSFYIIENIKFYPFSGNFTWTIFQTSFDTIFASGTQTSASDLFSLYFASLKLNPQCLNKNYYLDREKYECLSKCENNEEIGGYACLEFKDQQCMNCNIKEGYSCNRDVFKESTEYCPISRNMKLTMSQSFYNDEEKKIILIFNNEIVFLPFKINLILISSEGLKSKSINYSNFTIQTNRLIINKVIFSNEGTYSFINIDLDNLKISNILGFQLTNSKFNLSLIDIRISKSNMYNISEIILQFVTNNL